MSIDIEEAKKALERVWTKLDTGSYNSHEADLSRHLSDAIRTLEQQQSEISELKTKLTCKDEFIKDLKSQLESAELDCIDLAGDVKARDEVIRNLKSVSENLESQLDEELSRR